MKRILILGNKGFIGESLSDFFKKKKIKFSTANKNNLKQKIYQSNLIINCVGENFDKKKMFNSNYKFVKKIVNLIVKSNKKKTLVHISSCAVYGKFFHDNKYKKININTKTSPVSFYSITKLLADEYIISKMRLNNCNYIIIRPSQIVGKNMKAAGYINLVKFIKKKIFFYIQTKLAIRNYVSIEDFCNFILYIIKNKRRNYITIVSQNISLKNIVEYVQSKAKKKYSPLTLPKKPIILIQFFIKIFYKGFPLTKGIIDGLSNLTKIETTCKNFKFKKNFFDYLNNILK